MFLFALWYYKKATSCNEDKRPKDVTVCCLGKWTNPQCSWTVHWSIHAPVHMSTCIPKLDFITKNWSTSFLCNGLMSCGTTFSCTANPNSKIWACKKGKKCFWLVFFKLSSSIRTPIWTKIWQNAHCLKNTYLNLWKTCNQKRPRTKSTQEDLLPLPIQLSQRFHLCKFNCNIK